MFWGVTLESGKRYSQTVDSSYHLTMAALEPRSLDGDQGKPKKNSQVSVLVEHGKAEFLLSTLDFERTLQMPLDLVFVEGEEVTFFINGEGTVHLTGYVLPDDEGFDQDGYPFDEEVSDEEDDEDDSDALEAIELPIGKKRKGEDQFQASLETKGKKQKVNEQLKSNMKAEKVPAKGAVVANGSKQTPKETQKQKNQVQSNIKKPVNKVESDADDDSDEDDSDDNDLSGDAKMAAILRDINAAKRQAGDDEDSEDDSEDDDDDDDDDESDEDEDILKLQQIKKQQGKAPVNQKQGTPKSNLKQPESGGKKTPQQNKQQQQQKKQTPQVQNSPKGQQNQNQKQKGSGGPKTPNQPGKGQNQKSPNQGQNQKTPNSNMKEPSHEMTPKSEKKLKLAGGLIVEDLQVGSGPLATKDKLLHVHYVGRLANKKEFDRSSNKPFSFRLGRGEVIKGWDLGFEGMKVGGKRRLVVPPSMGYGSRPAGQIPPNSSLHFDVELKAVS